MAKKKDKGNAGPALLEQIKKAAVIAMFADDELLDRLVLKGGNALDLIHKISTRASVDVDFSMAADFSEVELQEIRTRIGDSLRREFQTLGFVPFDISVELKPSNLTPDLDDFWGGYDVAFKLSEQSTYERFSEDLDELRKRALQLGEGTKFEIDISRHEYVEEKQRTELDGFAVYVYSPEMIVCEKLRAICQQMPEYGPVIKRSRPGTARARDFIDIHTLMTVLGIDLTSEKNRQLLRRIFAAKRVPLALLGQVFAHRAFHRTNYDAVAATVKAGVVLHDFDLYFDFVVQICRDLKTLWDE